MVKISIRMIRKMVLEFNNGVSIRNCKCHSGTPVTVSQYRKYFSVLGKCVLVIICRKRVVTR